MQNPLLHASIALSCLTVSTACTAWSAEHPASSAQWLGLYPAQAFHTVPADCTSCGILPQAAWYFEHDLLSVALDQNSITAFTAALTAQEDVRQSAQLPVTEKPLPPLIWRGIAERLQAVQLQASPAPAVSDQANSAPANLLDKGRLPDGSVIDLQVVPKIPTNLSYLDQTSWAFYRQRPLALGGQTKEQGEFTIRTIWPMDFKLEQQTSASPLQDGETLQTLVRQSHGGAQSPYHSRILWQRQPASSPWQDKPALGIMLNGAQGDDDEAHGGHFAVLTGRVGEDGDWSQWLVNNFYNLDAYGEKGIIAAITPAENYLFDLNSGQSFYRPSYMLVAILKNAEAAQRYQTAINRVFQHFYRHDIVYHHSAANCAGLNIDTLRTLGWNIPTRGHAGYMQAIAAWFYVAVTQQDLTAARQLYDYLTQESTRLYPAVAFDAIGHDLLNLVAGKLDRPLSAYERDLADQIEALVYVHIPQIPSERAFGQAPVYSFAEYLAQAPAERKDWKIIPTTPRPFPPELRDGASPTVQAPFPVPWTVAAVLTGLIGLLGLGGYLIKTWYQRKRG
ncbi:hypothetical protein [Methylobacillus glycogenes]|uniref:hypothetical protein n=1 Tax=Methylobacillus glycogenes TaxID=406 RepID=UPI0005640DED|nr:hypothetical protein [Methylobacillus glycogenes]